MIPPLPTEIIQNIVRQACGDDDGSDACKFDRQRQLAALMTVSKVCQFLALALDFREVN
jgi:hypothetical protein